MSQSSGFNQMKEQAKQIVHERIQKSIPVLREMQPPATRSPSVSQSSRSQDEEMIEKEFSQMAKEEIDEETHKIVTSVFSFMRSLARVINGGNDQKEIKKFITAETIQELEFVLKNHT